MPVSRVRWRAGRWWRKALRNPDRCVDRAELVTQSGDGVAFGQDGASDSGGVSWDGWDFLWFGHRSFLRFYGQFATGIDSYHHPDLRSYFCPLMRQS